jgi:hypothetical protein
MTILNSEFIYLKWVSGRFELRALINGEPTLLSPVPHLPIFELSSIRASLLFSSNRIIASVRQDEPPLVWDGAEWQTIAPPKWDWVPWSTTWKLHSSGAITVLAVAEGRPPFHVERIAWRDYSTPAWNHWDVDEEIFVQDASIDQEGTVWLAGGSLDWRQGEQAMRPFLGKLQGRKLLAARPTLRRRDDRRLEDAGTESFRRVDATAENIVLTADPRSIYDNPIEFVLIGNDEWRMKRIRHSIYTWLHTRSRLMVFGGDGKVLWTIDRGKRWHRSHWRRELRRIVRRSGSILVEGAVCQGSQVAIALSLMDWRTEPPGLIYSALVLADPDLSSLEVAETLDGDHAMIVAVAALPTAAASG